MTIIAVFLATLIGIVLNDIYLGYLIRHDEDIFRKIRDAEKRLSSAESDYHTLLEQIIELKKEKARLSTDNAAIKTLDDEDPTKWVEKDFVDLPQGFRR